MSTAQSFEKLSSSLAGFFDYTDELIGIGAEAAADELHLAIVSSDRYDDDTTGTRESSIAYVAGREDAAAEAAYARGLAANPDDATIEEIDGDGDGDALTIVGTAFMYYDDPLEARREFLSAAMFESSDAMTAALAAALTEGLES